MFLAEQVAGRNAGLGEMIEEEIDQRIGEIDQDGAEGRTELQINRVERPLARGRAGKGHAVGECKSESSSLALTAAQNCRDSHSSRRVSGEAAKRLTAAKEDRESARIHTETFDRAA
jgi:hypothetical protein